MKLETFIGTNCAAKHCPTVYKTDRGTFAVQGDLIDPTGLNGISIAPQEGIVEIPEALVRALANKLAER
jgi:hypothetical protein